MDTRRKIELCLFHWCVRVMCFCSSVIQCNFHVSPSWSHPSSSGSSRLSFSPSLHGAPLKEMMPLPDMVTDRLPWLSYHSADAVHSKGTVL